MVISIRAPGMEPADLAPGWPAVLSVEIEDVDLHGQLDPAFDLRPAADAIAQFVCAHRRARHLLVHCHAGVSRSRTVAAAVCDAFGWPYRWTVRHQPLYDALAAALRHHVDEGTCR
ncbi:MAG: dual specificity protein phosphatase family protein [Gemmatimonadaceae bacterium]|nr:dual specificity protein phosphatase family protein [Gemmatimonadaceae bacterium]